MRIACDFHWEMGHRIAEHGGACRNLHGHSYRMRVTVEGDVQPDGMVMDFYDVKRAVEPVVDALDHCFMCHDADDTMVEFFRAHPMKVVVVPFVTSAENIAMHVLGNIVPAFVTRSHVRAITVRVEETASSFAEAHASLSPHGA